MSQKNETTILILAVLITLSLLGGGFWLFRQTLSNWLSPGNNSSNSPASSSAQNRRSLGGTLLIPADTTPQKQAGVKAFSDGDFKGAIAQFKSSLQIQPNDPEALIYLNNAQFATQNPIKIAVVVPIGGNLDIAKEMLRGVAQGQNEINQQGKIQGRGLQVEIVNDDNNPETAQQVAKQLVNDSNILAVIGHNSSDATIAAVPEYQQGELVMISPTSNATAIPKRGNFIFRTVPSLRFEADTLSRYTINKAKTTNVAVCLDSTAGYSQSYKEDFTSAIYADGGKIIEVNCDFADPNFNPNTIMSQAISSGADGLLLIPSVDRINLALNLAQANRQRLSLLGSSTLYTYQTLEDGQQAVNGMVLVTPWHPDAFKNNPFPANAIRLWGGEVNWRSALSYDALQAIIAGFKSGAISRQGLQNALSAQTFSSKGATGDIQFLPSGDRNGAAILIKIEARQPSKSGTGFDFVPLSSQ
ncbi:Extracellular ligand-binding receptor [Gloeothece citriformis PCC 7424]|uniref:Extracellular ligand-binding receptor n=1 Tax=Gloeothece citriformis (strain PCC 7424) TaxID=65393 RepID=B7K7I5_GLOC7|nr:ABC transporter substrate-binding protein [Gloeothece citriformis]ACK69753.1 Extracellular ligand-binding receptor [Gloeothece citriformis PCC 7424]